MEGGKRWSFVNTSLLRVPCRNLIYIYIFISVAKETERERMYAEANCYKVELETGNNDCYLLEVETLLHQKVNLAQSTM